MSTVLLDVDGVLADFTGAACRELSEIIGRKVMPSECTRWDFGHNFDMAAKQYIAWDKRIRRKGFCENLEELPGAKKFVNSLVELDGVSQIFFVTAPWYNSPFWMPERTAWLTDRFGFSPAAVIHTEQKYMVRGEVIVDDKPSNILCGKRVLRVLVPNTANAAWRKAYGGCGRGVDDIVVTKSWPSILAAISEVVEEPSEAETTHKRGGK